MTTIKNSNCDKTQKLNCDIKKNKIATKIKNLTCEKKVKKKTQIVIKLKTQIVKNANATQMQNNLKQSFGKNNLIP